MTRRDLAAIGVRLMAILAVLLGVHSFGSGLSNGLLDNISRSGGWGLMLHQGLGILLRVFGPFIVLCCLSVALWVMADALAYFIAGQGGRGEAATAFQISALDALVVLLSVTGIYLTIVGVVSSTNLISGWLFHSSPNTYLDTSNSIGFYLPALLSDSINFGFGLLLIFRASHIANSLPATRQLLVQSPLVTVKNIGRDAEHLIVPEVESHISIRSVEPEQE